jgi:hypothetical protein
LYAAPGTWNLVDVQLCDTAGDCQDYQGSALAAIFSNTTFSVTNNGTPDTTPPTVTSGKILTPKVSLSAASPQFLAQLGVADDLSGVIYPLVFIEPPGANSSFAYDINTSRPLLSGTAIEQDFINPSSPTGTWTIFGYGACDLPGNCFYDFNSSDVIALFGKNTFTVTN